MIMVMIMSDRCREMTFVVSFCLLLLTSFTLEVVMLCFLSLQVLFILSFIFLRHPFIGLVNQMWWKKVVPDCEC